MKIFKDIKDVEFNDTNVYGTWMPVSEPIAMASAAGWYVGAVCKDPDMGGMIAPYNRFTEYFATPEEVQKIIDTPMEEGGFYEG
jgi:hypothetical protein|tara:strand:+ start:65 stop:316 length:252 start_codon:yes stop_codon:yes gene_type:complete